MQLKIPPKISFFIVSSVGIVFFILIIFSINRSRLIVFTQGVVFREQIGLGLPVHFIIPKIGVDSTFEYVGLASSGTMDVPNSPANVAWFNLGPRPGEIGSAVIAGHSGWKDGLPAVFDNLYRLEIGDRLYVEDERGMVVTFIVRKIRTYNSDSNTSDIFSSSDGKAHLNLITCVGIWDKVLKSSLSRLVVFTDKEEK